MRLTLPPPVLFLGCALAMWFVPPFYVFPRYWIMILLLWGASAGIALMSLWQFMQANTTVSPFSPEKSTVLVTNGVYRISRNPMYLSLALLLLAWALWLGSLSAVIFFMLFILLMTEMQIKREELALEKLFGETYVAYKQQVRRWL
ncbi:isoprenylcysteine carboxyl methyltransferase [Pasteurella multocida subsp. multocida OH4807]|nr:isoprenylcysteine carboxyl methyltransferase [Pasteurella multocida subsp. multocida OH4807]